MFNIGDKVKVREDYWEICKIVHQRPHLPIQKVREEMAKSIGQILIIKDKKDHFYLLMNEKGVTDGFAWHEKFLETVV